MNTKDFIKALRTVIREEVRAAVRQEVKEIMIESVHRAANLPTTSTQATKPKQPIKRYTGNSVLDQVLNETKLTSDFRQSPTVEYDEMSFTTENIATPAPQLMSMLDMEPSDDVALPQASTNNLPFMKDYSQLMKKADQISKNKTF